MPAHHDMEYATQATTGPSEYVLRAEGVNFDATVFDTEDISTIRGAGLALLNIEATVTAALKAAQVSEMRILYAGASKIACAFTATAELAETIRADVMRRLSRCGPAREPFGHLSFVVDLVASTGESAADRAEARNHARQLRQWTVPLPGFAEGARDFDPVDRARPAVRNTHLPPGKLPGTEDSEETVRLLSTSTGERHCYGRRMRRKFYADNAAPGAAADLLFADSFEEIVASAPAGLPLSLCSKLAVVYADGNGFGALAKSDGFSQRLRGLQQGLLEQILDWLRRGAGSTASDRFALLSRNQRYLRFETLLWGGDEMMFVLPSWLALAFLEGFFSATSGWAVGEPLTHSVGVVICHHKTPIRLARQLVYEIVDGLKDGLKREFADPNKTKQNAVSIEIFESLMPPLDGLAAHRAGVYDTPDPGALALAFPGEGPSALPALVETLAQRLPRSQLYRLLRAARAKGGLASATASTAALEMLEDYARRVQKVEATEVRLPKLDGIPVRPFALDLALIAQLWDYVAPCEGDALPPFIASGAAS